MPNSLKCKIKHLCHNGTITERERDRILKALEQEPILDEMMAEINELYSYVEFDENIKTSFNMVRLEEVQKVIDKYRAESEGKGCRN